MIYVTSVILHIPIDGFYWHFNTATKWPNRKKDIRSPFKCSFSDAQNLPCYPCDGGRALSTALVSMTTAAAEVFFCRLPTLYSLCLSRVGGGNRVGGRRWGADACSPGRWSPFIPAEILPHSCFPSEWLRCFLTKRRDATNLFPETQTFPSGGFVSKLVSKKH